MEITTLSAVSLCKAQVIAIGRQMENEYRQIIFDCSGFGPGIASITLVHQRSQDTAPYIVGTFNSNPFVWTIDDTDTAYYGYGKGELRISFASGLAKSIVFTTLTVKSITADTVIPEPLQSWYDAMIDYIDENAVTLDEVDQAIEDYLDEHPVQAPVTSVNSKIGAVVLNADDVGALPDTTTASDLGAYVKPNTGIPKTDLSTAVQASLDKADTALQSAPVTSVNSKTGAVVLTASDVGALPDTTTAADLGAYVKPTGGIPKTDLASDVQTSLGKADTALQTAPVTSVNGRTGTVTGLAEEWTVQNMTASDTSVTLQTGKFYVFPTMDSLTVTVTATGMYAFRFTSGATPTTLTVTGATMPDSFTVEANKVYEVNVYQGYGVVQSWS